MKLVLKTVLLMSCLCFAKDEVWWGGLSDASLDQLMVRFNENNIDLKIDDLNLEVTQAQKNQLRSTLFPKARVRGNYDVFPFEDSNIPVQAGADAPGTFQSGGLFVGLNYDLSSWGEAIYEFKSVDNNKRANELSSNFNTLNLQVQFVSLYLNAVYGKEQQAILEKQVSISENLLELTNLRYINGEASGLSLLQQKQQLASIKVSFPQARNTYRQNMESLLQMLNEKEGKLEIADRLPNLSVIQFVGDEEQLLSQRDDIQAQKEQWKAAKNSQTAAIWSNMPSLNLIAETGYNYSKGYTETTDETWRLGASFTLNLFNGFGSKAKYQEARAKAKISKWNLRQSELAASKDLKKLQIQIEEMTLQLEAYQLQYDAAKLSYEESLKQYKNGLVTYSETLVSLNTYQQAEIALLNAKRNTLELNLNYVLLTGGRKIKG